MKAFRLLATSLLVALSMGISSCGDDELESVPPITENNYMDIINKLFAEYIKDYSNIKCRFGLQGEETVLLSGIKNILSTEMYKRLI